MGNKGGIPKRLSCKAAKALLVANGWVEVQGGKHVVKMTKSGQRPITLPTHKGEDYSPGLTSAILSQAGLKKPAETDDQQEQGTAEGGDRP